MLRLLLLHLSHLLLLLCLALLQLLGDCHHLLQRLVHLRRVG